MSIEIANVPTTLGFRLRDLSNSRCLGHGQRQVQSKSQEGLVIHLVWRAHALFWTRPNLHLVHTER